MADDAGEKVAQLHIYVVFFSPVVILTGAEL